MVYKIIIKCHVRACCMLDFRFDFFGIYLFLKLATPSSSRMGQGKASLECTRCQFLENICILRACNRITVQNAKVFGHLHFVFKASTKMK